MALKRWYSPLSEEASDAGSFTFSGSSVISVSNLRKAVSFMRINSVDFSVKGWTDRSYYEICTDPAIYAALERRKGAGKS